MQDNENLKNNIEKLKQDIQNLENLKNFFIEPLNQKIKLIQKEILDLHFQLTCNAEVYSHQTYRCILEKIIKVYIRIFLVSLEEKFLLKIVNLNME